MTEDLRHGMVLAQTVLLDNGVLLVPKDTMLNKNGYAKLVKNRVRGVYVKETSIDYEQPLFKNDENVDNYAEFKRTYEKQSAELRAYLYAVGAGEKIDADVSVHAADSIFAAAKTSDSAFVYLEFLREDGETYSHSANVALLAHLFGLWLGYDKERLKALTIAGTLNDIGKTQVPAEILEKKGKLTPEEFGLVRKHPLYGYRMIEGQNISEEIKHAALMHHERVDGTGYPLGVKGSRITEFAKIIMICDIYDAMTSNRVYHNKRCPFDVIHMFETEMFGTLDREYMNIFLRNIAYTYIGSQIKLNDGRVGEVLFINKRDVSTRIVRVGDERIDLSMRKDCVITEIL